MLRINIQVQFLLVFFGFFSCQMYCAAAPLDPLSQLIGAMQEKRIARIEVVAISKYRMTNRAMTSEELEKYPDYRIIISNTLVDRKVLSLLELLRSAEIDSSQGPIGEVRMGVILYGADSVRIGDMFISARGNFATVNSKKISLKTSVFKPGIETWFGSVADQMYY